MNRCFIHFGLLTVTSFLLVACHKKDSGLPPAAPPNRAGQDTVTIDVLPRQGADPASIDLTDALVKNFTEKNSSLSLVYRSHNLAVPNHVYASFKDQSVCAADPVTGKYYYEFTRKPANPNRYVATCQVATDIPGDYEFELTTAPPKQDQPKTFKPCKGCVVSIDSANQ